MTARVLAANVDLTCWPPSSATMAPSPIVFPPYLDLLNDQETLLALLATIVLILVTGVCSISVA